MTPSTETVFFQIILNSELLERVLIAYINVHEACSAKTQKTRSNKLDSIALYRISTELSLHNYEYRDCSQ